MKGLISILCLILIACSEPKVEVVSMSDIVAQSERYSEDQRNDSIEVQGIYFDSLSEQSKAFISDLGLDPKSISSNAKSHIVDRFNPLSKENWQYISDSLSFRVKQWQFKDSAACQNAFLNYLDCMGKACEPLRLWESKKLKGGSFILIQFESELWFFEGIGHEAFSPDNSLLSEFVKKNKWQALISKKGKSSCVWWDQLWKTKSIVPHQKVEFDTPAPLDNNESL